ncbi:MAG: NAD(+) diphosphatase, partial [Pseudomonadota bacterium]|nr:NAD(+) diphosphatase [Pseudomonadota bacterium]
MSSRSFFLQRESLIGTDRLVLFCDNRVVVKDDNFIWQHKHVIDLLPADAEFLLIDHDGKQFIAAHTAHDISDKISADTRSLRSLLFKESDIDFSIAGKASQILSWYRTHRYCGVCGNKTSQHEDQRVLFCANCGEQYFPRINPCAIVLVTKGREILLARSARFRTGFYSCLAGFIEVGESAEDTVLREVKEEAGVEIENIRYVKSQSWPFPSQLMLGFHADYKSGEIVPEPGEIEEAN